MRAGLTSLPIASLSLVACIGEPLVDEQSDDQTADFAPPTLEVTAPSRASFAETDTVVVRGVADAAAGLAEVTVNGQAAKLSDDGSFSITLELPETITLLETVATDETGNEIVDARAILAGTLVDQDTPVPEAMAAHMSEAAMSGLGEMVSGFANDTDWTAMARSQNPVATSGSGCNEYQAYVTRVSHGAIEFSTRAATGGIRVTLRIRDLRVNGHIDWRALCANGTTSYTITADSYEMGGLVIPGFVRGAMAVTVQDVTSQFQNFRLNASGVPGWIEDRFQDQARDYLAGMARDFVRQEVPPIAKDFLADFTDNEVVFEVLGQPIHMQVRPTAMSWTDQGGTILLESSSYVPGLAGGVYLANSQDRPRPGSTGGSGLEIAVAADALNQLLAAIWHSGALEDALLPEEASALGAILQADVSHASATMLLPPVVSFDGERGVSQVTLGDVLIEAFGPDGDSLVTFAISAEIEIEVGARADGGLRLRTGTSRVLAQVLDSAPGVRASGSAVSSLVELLVPQVGRQAQSLFDEIPVPGLPGGEISSPVVLPHDGYLVAGGEISFD